MFFSTDLYLFVPIRIHFLIYWQKYNLCLHCQSKISFRFVTTTILVLSKNLCNVLLIFSKKSQTFLFFWQDGKMCTKIKTIINFKSRFTVLVIRITPLNSNALTPSENFLKNRDFLFIFSIYG